MGYEIIVRKHSKDIVAKAGWGALWRHYDTLSGWYKGRNDLRSRINFIRCKTIFLVGKCVCYTKIGRKVIGFTLENNFFRIVIKNNS